MRFPWQLINVGAVNTAGAENEGIWFRIATSEILALTATNGSQASSGNNLSLRVPSIAPAGHPQVGQFQQRVYFLGRGAAPTLNRIQVATNDALEDLQPLIIRGSA